MTPTLEADPDCARPTVTPRLRAVRRAFSDIPRATWDRLAARNPWATPFSAWAFHRAWWDAYGKNAHEQTLVLVDPDRRIDADPVAIVPLMHRHVVEPGDAETHTSIRHGSPVNLTPLPPTAKAIYFGASYHADYATILAAPDDLPAVARALVEELGAEAAPDPKHPATWDVIDLRRLRSADPAADALATAFGKREIPEGWTLNVEREDVCPVLTLADGVADFDGYLATLDAKTRHEIRRKLRRAQSRGEVRFDLSTDPVADLPAFIDLHNRRWGAEGLFPPTPGGDQSRHFFNRLFELFGADGSLALAFLSIDGQRIASSMHLETADSLLYYNAGIDPTAHHFSPGVLLAASVIGAAIEHGKRRVDFLRGDEPYKYEWGAVDEPIQRLLVRRTAD